ncbi:Methyltransferase OMS1 [Emericellopsis cladophorae]|uniref:Methyltransferase OMS1 n=1 Tax=Emericellopsis cladophorae TaxID=2686198 RepID=A0A9Q0BG08_9HYPO|nr:Methyltransferase OMS1 [Emericellopsis cladophorae]KAI6784532.1 Methyltransferase OMS1 [Emericellopsis cladophorae]
MICSARGLLHPRLALLHRPQWQRLASSSARGASPKTKTKTSKPPRPIPYKPSSIKPREPNLRDHVDPPEPQTVASIWKTHWLPLSGAVLLAGALGFYIVGTVTASVKASGCPCVEHSIPTGRPPALTGDNADTFDKELDFPEWWMGIRALRKRLAAEARGNVLELAMGGGRNLEYYDWFALSQYAAGRPNIVAKGVTSFTGLDISADMLDVARRRLVKAVPPMKDSAPVVAAATMPDRTGGQLSYLDGHLRLVNSDAHKSLPATARGDKYDTVVQTFGLCSVSDPVAVLTNLASAVKPNTGKIILLEHGKGWFGILNGLLDKDADKHFAKYGCWWNRDIQGLVEEAAQKTPGLEIVKIERPKWLQFGTLVWVELRVKDASP